MPYQKFEVHELRLLKVLFLQLYFLIAHGFSGFEKSENTVILSG
jgi:hypothetical protein